MPIVGILGVNVNLHLSNLSPLLFLSYRSPLSLLISLISLISLTHSPHASNHLIRTLTYYPSPLLSLSSPSPLFPLILPTPLTPLTSHPSYPFHYSSPIISLPLSTRFPLIPLTPLTLSPPTPFTPFNSHHVTILNSHPSPSHLPHVLALYTRDESYAVAVDQSRYGQGAQARPGLPSRTFRKPEFTVGAGSSRCNV